jgi:hypothetical protein
MRLGFTSFTLPPYGQEKKINTPHAHSSSQHTPNNDGSGYHKDRRRHYRKYPLGYPIPSHPLVRFPLGAVYHIIAGLRHRTTERREARLENGNRYEFFDA